MENKYEKYIWTKDSYAVFVSDLNLIAEEKYKKFQSNLIPNIDNILGIRLPIIRSIAKDISKGSWKDYFKVCQNNYYEETMIQGCVLNYLNIDLDELVKYMSSFVEKIDNWATCDTFCCGMKIVKRNKEFFYPYIQTLISSNKEYYIRTGLVLLLAHYICEEYIDKIFTLSNSVDQDSYYVKMANAWLIASCYNKFRDKAMSFLKNSSLDDWTHNKSIQKIIESKKTTPDEKILLKKLKR